MRYWFNMEMPLEKKTWTYILAKTMLSPLYKHYNCKWNFLISLVTNTQENSQFVSPLVAESALELRLDIR